MTKPAFQTQSAKDEQAAAAKSGAIDKKRWFDVPDSLFEDDDGNKHYNVKAKFSDHFILNVAKSKVARHNVYDIGICLHTKVVLQSDASPAKDNGTSHVMRFDKGDDERISSYRPGPDGKEVIHYDGKPGMGKEAFDAAVRDIMRCWDAWEHYQKFRQAPVHPLEIEALALINEKPLDEIGTLLVDRGNGVLERVKVDEDDHDDDDEEISPPVRSSKPRGKARKA